LYSKKGSDQIDVEALAKGVDVLIFNQRRLAGNPSIYA
jgi:hypothetical protein